MLVQNLAPGAAARLGLSYEALAPQKPALIVCDISGYGADGPYRDKKAYDLLIQSESGFLSVTGTEPEPSKAGRRSPTSPRACTRTRAFSPRCWSAQTGRGQHLDISLLESLVEWMNFPLYYAIDGQPPPPRTGASHATIYPYGPFPAGDGKVVMLGLQNEREWAVFCEQVLRRPELAKDPRFAGNAQRVAARDAVRRIIVERLPTHRGGGRAAARRRADRQRPGARHARRLGASAVARAERWREIDSPAGPMPSLLPPGSWRRARRAWTRCPRSGSIPTPSSRASATRPSASPRCAPRTPSSRHDTNNHREPHVPASIVDSAIFGNIFSTPAMRAGVVGREPHPEVPRHRGRAGARAGPARHHSAGGRRRDRAPLHARHIDMDKLRQATERIGYPVLGVVQQLVALCRDGLGEWCHWGATTQDITDTATVLQIREALEIDRRRPARDLEVDGRPRAQAPRHADDRPQQPAAGGAGDLRLQDGGAAVRDRAPSRAARRTAQPRADGRVRRRGGHARVAGEGRDGDAGRPDAGARPRAAGDRVAHHPRHHRRDRLLPRPGRPARSASCRWT